MAETPKAWMKESELALQRSRENAAKLETLQAAVTKMAVILKDLVYIEALDSDMGEKDILVDHQAALDEIIWAGTNEP